MNSTYFKMKRSREYVDQSCSKEVYVPFRKFIPAGHSLFTVDVPQSYATRDFFFSYLVLVPDFYSLQAAIMKLDADDELNIPITYEIFYKINLPTDQSLYPDTVTVTSNVTIPVTMTTTINDFFETKKADGTVHLGIFFDWYDLRFDDVDPNLTWDEYVRTIVAVEYYNRDFDENLHFNKLPLSARSIPGANNYLFPTALSDELYENLRWRINIAPMTDGLFSTLDQIKYMGFTEDQFGGKRKYKSKYMLENDSKLRFLSVMADDSPVPVFGKCNALTVSLKSHALFYNTHPFEFQLTKEEYLKNSNFTTTIKKALKDYSNLCNFTTGFNYDSTSKVFSFAFPENTALTNLIITLPVELSERLGFDFVTDIKKFAPSGKPVNDSFNIKEAETKARALAYDTSLVIISHQNSSSNTTAGINYSYMAALYPTGFGTLEISSVEACFKPPTMKLPITLYGKPATVPATFKLSRFLDNSELSNLIWTNGAYVFGVLRGLDNNLKT